MKIYCLSGLGADERAFQYIDTGVHAIEHMPWIDPLENESLRSYAHRMAARIDVDEPFALMGLSFGGMLAVEINKIKPAVQLILLSTICSHQEKPLRMRISGKLGLYNLVPARYFTQPSRIAHRLFGAQTDRERQLLNEILADGDPNYVKWALNAISRWKNTDPVTAVRIHGTADKILPARGLPIDHLIPGGGHLMVISHAPEVSVKICEALS